MKRTGMAVAGGLWLLVGAAGLWHATRTGSSQIDYRAARAAALQSDWGAALRFCERSQRRYPFNYYACLLAAESAHSAGDLSAAEYWCDAGLQLNRFRRPLRVLKAGLIAKRSPAAAVAYWQEYLEWQFWDPFNHAVLCGLLVLARDTAAAAGELKWLEGSPYHEPLRRELQAAWRRESQFPPP